MRREFNTERPHEALGQTAARAPLCAVAPALPRALEEPWYDATHQVRRVKQTGQIKWQGELIFVSEAVRGELVGLAETRARRLARPLHAGGTGPHRSTDAAIYAGVAWLG